MGCGPWLIFSTTSRFKCKAGLRGWRIIYFHDLPLKRLLTRRLGLFYGGAPLAANILNGGCPLAAEGAVQPHHRQRGWRVSGMASRGKAKKFQGAINARHFLIPRRWAPQPASPNRLRLQARDQQISAPFSAPSPRQFGKHDPFFSTICPIFRHRHSSFAAVGRHQHCYHRLLLQILIDVCFFLKKNHFLFTFGFFASIFNNFSISCKLGCAFHGVAGEFARSGWCQC